MEPINLLTASELAALEPMLKAALPADTVKRLVGQAQMTLTFFEELRPPKRPALSPEA